ncbi:MAG: response regulator [bacterium]|nr:response regulator [bacterium]
MNTAKKILIIEDEKSLARALELKLTHAGFETMVVFNGEDAVELLEKETFALILLDLIMPKMDGFTLLAILKVKKIKTPVMVLTNLSQQSDMRRTKEFGAKEFFIKSNTPIATIVERVVELLK